MELDARATTHPIQQPVTRDSEAESAFDTITYDKGSAFLRMLEAWLGEAAFRDGIRAYLKRHQYANTTSADLWAALAAASGKPVAAIAADWTTQPGFPLLDVDAQCDGGRRRIVVRQQPFRVPDDGAGGGAARRERRWSVPVQLGSVGGRRRRDYLLLREAQRRPSSATTIAPRRWSSTPTTSASSASAMPRRCSTRWRRAGRDLPDGARLKLLADTSALVRADQAPLARWLALVERIDDEPRLAVWDQLLADLERFDRLRRRRAGAPGPASLRRRRARAALRQARLGRARRRARRGAPAARPAGGGARRATAMRRRSPKGSAASRAGSPSRPAWRLRSSTRSSRSPAATPTSPPTRPCSRWRGARRPARSASAPTARWRRRATRRSPRAPCSSRLDRDVPQIVRHELLASVARWGHRELAWTYAREHADALLADMKLYDGGQAFAAIVVDVGVDGDGRRARGVRAGAPAGRRARRRAPRRGRDPHAGGAEVAPLARARGDARRSLTPRVRRRRASAVRGRARNERVARLTRAPDPAPPRPGMT